MKNEKMMQAVGMISDEYILEAHDSSMRPKKRKVKIAVILAAAALAITVPLPAMAAADNEKAYDILYGVSPAIAQTLKPVHDSSTDNGITFEVLSTGMTDYSAFAYLALHDNEGDRIRNKTLVNNLEYHLGILDDKLIGSCEYIGYDEENQRALLLMSIVGMDAEKPDIEGKKVTLTIHMIESGIERQEVNWEHLDYSGITRTPEWGEDVQWNMFSNGDDAQGTLLEIQPDYVQDVNSALRLNAIAYQDGFLYLQGISPNALNHLQYCDLLISSENEWFPKHSAPFCGSIYEGNDLIHQWRVKYPEEKLNDISLHFYTEYGDEPIRGTWRVTFPFEEGDGENVPAYTES